MGGSDVPCFFRYLLYEGLGAISSGLVLALYEPTFLNICAQILGELWLLFVAWGMEPRPLY